MLKSVTLLKRIVFLGNFFLLYISAQAQKPNLSPNNDWKLSPALLYEMKENKLPASGVFIVVTNNATALQKWLDINKIHAVATTAHLTYTVQIKNSRELGLLIKEAPVYFISRYNTHPQPELQINNLDLSTNEINLVHSRWPALNGDATVLSLKENKPDTADIDIAGRYIPNPLSSSVIDPHAAITATMAAGAGNSWYLGLGAAWGANITSSDFANLLPDPATNYQQYHITVQNHSYGVGVENFYGADAAAFDAAALSNDKLLFVFSAGNSGTTTPQTGMYSGIPKTANLTGSFKMAKNIITVGATDSFYNVAAQSSKGPAYDGRIKPEMVAYGEDGSSGAAALVSGTALVLQQAYKNSNGGTLPSSSLIKAVLLNSCDDVGSPGIDFSSGFGSLNAYKAVEEMNAQAYFTGSVAGGSVQNFTLAVPANISKLKCTLVWNDLPTQANAITALKNDLDLRVTAVASGQTYLPWVLSSAPHADSLVLSPVRKRDSLNNIEQVSIDNPLPGNYTIAVNGFSVTGAAQSFSIAYALDTANNFSWHFPAAADNIFPAVSNLIRWSTSFTGTATGLDYSIDNGNSWQSIATNLNLSPGYFRWAVPDTNVVAKLRMRISTAQFISDAFTISARPEIRVGFNCPDSVMLIWNKNKGISNYRVFGLGAKYLEPAAAVSDTQFIFSKNSLLYTHFAVAGIMGSKTGVKSYTIDFRDQGVGCYVSTFTADVINNNTVQIRLELGTTYLVNKIVFEKLNDGSFIPLAQINNITGLDYSATDLQLQKGTDTYRAAIYLSDGRIIYSNAASVIYYAEEDILVYPDPVIRGSDIHIHLHLLNNQSITLFDLAGRKVFHTTAAANDLSIPATYSGGFYILKIDDPETHISKAFKVILM